MNGSVSKGAGFIRIKLVFIIGFQQGGTGWPERQ
jgi:hypothetical protein